jgi:hypothetical protein
MKPEKKHIEGKPQDKKQYVRPVLEKYGSVAKLSRLTISGDMGDGGANPLNKRY